MSGTDILDLELEEQRSRLDRLIQEFRRGLPKPFAHAAAELEFEKIVEFHLNLSPGELGQKALVKELQPSTDTDRIDQSLREIAEMRTMLTSNDRPPFMGLSDIRPTLRKVEHTLCRRGDSGAATASWHACSSGVLRKAR